MKQIIKSGHGCCLDIIGNVNVWFHRLVVGMPRPFHDDLRRYSEGEGVTDECASACMRTKQCVLWCHDVDTFIALIIGLSHRLVYFGNLSEFFEIGVEFLICYDSIVR